MTRREEWELRGRHKVAMVLHQCRGTGAPQVQVLVYIVSRIPDDGILEQTEFYPKDVIRPGFHLLAATEHYSRPYIPRPAVVNRE